MKNRRMIWLAAILLMAGAEVVAQNHGEERGRRRPTAEQMAADKTNKMAEVLALSPEQVEQVGRLNREYVAKHQAHREAMRQERKQQKEALRSILSPEQYARWEQIEQEHRPHGDFRPGMRGDSMPPHRGECPPPGCRCRKPRPQGDFCPGMRGDSMPPHPRRGGGAPGPR